MGRAWLRGTTSLKLWLAGASVRRSRRNRRLGSGKFRTLGRLRPAPPPAGLPPPGEGSTGSRAPPATASRRARPEQQAAMVPEDRSDCPGAGKESARLQAAGTVRKVGVPGGRGAPGGGLLDPASPVARCRRRALGYGIGAGFSRPSAPLDSGAKPRVSHARQRQGGLNAGELEPRAEPEPGRWAPV